MKTIFNKNHITDAILIVSFISIFAAFISIACYGPGHPVKHNRTLESRAKSTLRAYGETELAYQYTNNDHYYGSWENLVETEYIARGYSGGNIIEGYSVWTAAFNPLRLAAEGDGYGCTFTAVAFPRITRPPGYLSTFAIREDQVLRAFRPGYGINAWGANGDYGTRTWEPVR